MALRKLNRIQKDTKTRQEEITFASWAVYHHIVKFDNQITISSIRPTILEVKCMPYSITFQITSRGCEKTYRNYRECQGQLCSNGDVD